MLEKVEFPVDDETTNVLIASPYGATSQALTKQLVKANYAAYTIATNSETAAALRNVGGIPIFMDRSRTGELTSNLKMAKANVLISFSPLLQLLPFSPDQTIAAEDIEAATSATLEAAEAAGVEFIILVSSTLLYGDSGEAVDESAALKDAGHPLLRAAIAAEKQVTASSIPSCIVRAGYNYSADSAGLSELAAKLPSGRTFPSGDPHNHAGWIHSDDLASALVQVVEKRPEGEAFNVVDDDPASPSAFLSHFGDAFGVSVSSPLPNPITMLFPPKDGADLLGLSAQPSNAKAKEQLDWSLKFANHQDGIEDVLLTWRAAMSQEA